MPTSSAARTRQSTALRHRALAPLTAPVLVAVADPLVRRRLTTALQHEGWPVSVARDAREAVAVATDVALRAAVLDESLPGSGCLAVRGALRRHQPVVPLAVLAAVDVTRLRTAPGSGAVRPPYVVRQVVERLRPLLAAAPAPVVVAAREPEPVVLPGGSEVVVGDLRLDVERRTVVRGETTIELTPTETRLLAYLMRNPRRVLSKAAILDRVWEWSEDGGENWVELYVSYLRRKLEPGGPRVIHTVRGVGYVLRPGG